MAIFKLNQLQDIHNAFSIELPQRKDKRQSKPKKNKICFAIRYKHGYFAGQTSRNYNAIIERDFSNDINDAQLFDSIATVQEKIHEFDLNANCQIVRVKKSGENRTILHAEENKWYGAGYGPDLSEFFKYDGRINSVE